MKSKRGVILEKGSLLFNRCYCSMGNEFKSFKIDSFKKESKKFKKNIEVYSVIDYNKGVEKRVKNQ